LRTLDHEIDRRMRDVALAADHACLRACANDPTER